MSPEVLTVEEAKGRLRCSRAKVFDLLAKGVLVRAPKYGRRTVVTAASIEAALMTPRKKAAQPRRLRIATFEADLRRVGEDALR